MHEVKISTEFGYLYPWGEIIRLPSHRVLAPLQVLFAWHTREIDPRRRNPSSQLNFITFGNTVKEPCSDPFRGTAREPQSTAVNEKL